MLAAVEFVDDKDSRAPFPRTAHWAETFTQVAQDIGLIVWPNVGHADGENGDAALVAPPFIVTTDEIDQIVDRLKAAILRTTKAVKVGTAS